MVATLRVIESMTIPLAKHIVGSSLGRASKMPGSTWGISAAACKRGQELARIPGSVCAKCYAARGHYSGPTVVAAHERRLAGVSDPRWARAMAYLIRAYDQRWFRWFDSGDIQDRAHLDKIVAVAKATRKTRHWLPTHEADLVGDYLADKGGFPDNLTVRLSADYIEDRATTPTHGLPTATVHKFKGEPVEFTRRNDSIECRAYLRGNTCGTCRACWDTRVQNVSFPLH